MSLSFWDRPRQSQALGEGGDWQVRVVEDGGQWWSTEVLASSDAGDDEALGT